MKYSTNLDFLKSDRPFPEAFRAAKSAAFDIVECHWPYDLPIEQTKAALAETGLEMRYQI